MPVLTKLTLAEFEAKEKEACTGKGKTPVVKVFAGDVPTELTFKDYDLAIDAGTYKWLVFVPCELIGEYNWVRLFGANYVVGLKNDEISPLGPRKPRTIKPMEYNVIELDNNGVLFAFN